MSHATVVSAPLVKVLGSPGVYTCTTIDSEGGCVPVSINWTDLTNLERQAISALYRGAPLFLIPETVDQLKRYGIAEDALGGPCLSRDGRDWFLKAAASHRNSMA